MALEILSHLIARELPGRVEYPGKGIISRSGTVFIIRAGFQYIVGNTVLSVKGIGVLARKLSVNRTMAWVFAHFLYLAALIMTLQGGVVVVLPHSSLLLVTHPTLLL
jgi:hypothetical protein